MARKYVNNFRGEMYFTPNGNLVVKNEPLTPIEDDFGEHNNLDVSFDNKCNFMRKSLSMSDITALKSDFIKLEQSTSNQDVYSRHSVRQNTHELSKTKFVSMAESIYHYQTDTPDRFHSVRPQIFRPQSSRGPVGLTVPQSPMLRCKSRSRPQHILSRKEIEEMELEEIRKFKLKANPVPKSVLEGPHLPEVPKKPVTIPEPFHLTQIQKKPQESSEHIPSFKARPAPKHILEKPKLPCKPPVSLTKPKSPKFHYKRANSAEPLKSDYRTNNSTNKEKALSCEKPQQRLGPVKPKPFSFEKRDEDLKKRHEEKIKRQIEEERKLATQFKAHPLPAAVKKRMQSCTGQSSTSTASSENKENHCKFEARPPLVLYKEPFKPVLKPLAVVEPVPFDLNTGKRALEREKFDKQLKEREEQIEKLRKEREREQLEAEEKAVAELRAKLVHHAKPVPPLEPFIPDKSILPITVPETPKFVRRLKQNS